MRCISKNSKDTPTVYPSQSQFTNHFVLPNLPLKEKTQIPLCPFNLSGRHPLPHHAAAASAVVTPPSRQWNYPPPFEGVTVRGKSVEKTREGSLGNLNLKTSVKLYV